MTLIMVTRSGDHPPSQFLDKISRCYNQEVVVHKNCKLFLADNASLVKKAHHCDAFALKAAGFCVTEKAGDLTVEFMNKR